MVMVTAWTEIVDAIIFAWVYFQKALIGLD